MKQILGVFFLTLGFFSCKIQTKETVDNRPLLSTDENKIKLHILEKRFVAGDFDGDGKQDTIFQHNYSKRTRSEIIYSADPFHNEWDTIVKWFYEQDADLYLTINKKEHDTLHVGIAQGLYSLINMGDINGDGNDEIAFVVDLFDFSRVNSCKIYSLCKGKWVLLKQFGIHEGVFDFDTDKPPLYDHIKHFLEKRNDKWFYKDYFYQGYDSLNGEEEMQLLKLNKCNE